MTAQITQDQRKALTSIVAALYEEHKRFIPESDLDGANEQAIEFIISAGFDSDDSDQLGDEMGDVVQTLLALAFARLGGQALDEMSW